MTYHNTLQLPWEDGFLSFVGGDYKDGGQRWKDLEMGGIGVHGM